MLLLFYSCHQDTTLESQIAKYNDIHIVDVHNHDASAYRYIPLLRRMKRYGIDQVVLFGSISEPAAKKTDRMALAASRLFPRRFIPFSAAVNIHRSECLDYLEAEFAKGSMGVGEVVGASQYSPVASGLAWKGEHPMSEYFPEVYSLSGEYKRPVLLHIDPLRGVPLLKLREALWSFPDTTFILAHGNAFNSPELLETLLKQFPNIYIDFYPGFTAFNSGSGYNLEDFVPLIEAYPNRFMLSSDSAFDLNYHQAYSAFYLLLELLQPETAHAVAGENFLRIIGSTSLY